ncbi:shikimate dehydrogenase family protein [Staphylococcus aureus subsp. aureus IS-160]|nr:shikimate dehydrogenase family protein [Staphylococcus aureus subsp. aureus IS-160]
MELNINQISLADAEKYLAEFDIVINTTPAVWLEITKVLLI